MARFAAEIPYDPSPNVDPTSQGAPYQSERATPGAFGGEVAGALEKGGGQLEEAGNRLFDAAIAKQQLTDEMMANDANTSAMQKMTDLWGAYQKNEGKAAYAAYPGFEQQLTDLSKSTLDSMPNMYSKSLLSKALAYQTDRWLRQGADYRDQQWRAWQDKTAMDGSTQYANQAILAVNDPKEMERQIYLGADQVRKYWEQRGFDRDEIQGEVTKYQGGVYKDAIKMKALDSPEDAMAMFNQYKGQMDAASQVETLAMLKQQGKTNQGRALGMAILGQSAAEAGVTVGGQTGAAGVPPAAGAETVPGKAGASQWSGGADNLQHYYPNTENQYGLPKGSLKGVVTAENSADDAVSPKGAATRYQIMPDTAKSLGYDIEDLKKNPQLAMQASAKYLGQMYAKYRDPGLMYAAYNAGPGAVDAFLQKGKPLPAETLAYVPRALAAAGLTSKYTFGEGSAPIASEPLGTPDQTRPPAPGVVNVSAETGGQTGTAAPPQATVTSGANLPPQYQGWPDEDTAYAAAARITDPQTRAETFSYLSQQFGERNKLLEDQQVAVTQRIQDQLAAYDSLGHLADGQTPVTDDDMRAAGFKDKQIAAQRQLLDLHHDKAVATSAFAFSPVDGDQARLQSFTPQGENIADQAALAKTAQTVLDEKNKALFGPSADPAAYALGHDPDLATKLNAAQGDPAKFQDYANSLNARYDQLGLPQEDRNILPKQWAEQLTAKIESQDDANPAANIAAIQKMAGPSWNGVYKDLVTEGKLSPSYQLLPALDSQKDQQMLSNWISSTRARTTKAGSSDQVANDVLGPERAKAIRDAVQPALSDYLLSRARSGSSPEQTANIIEGVTQLAYAKAYYGGDANPAASAAAAVAGKYDFGLEGGPAVPTERFNAVSTNAGMMLRGLTGDSIGAPGPFGRPGMPTANDYAADVQANHTWVTAPSMDRIWLMDRAGRIVRDNDGLPVTVLFAAEPNQPNRAGRGGFTVPGSTLPATPAPVANTAGAGT